MNFITFAAPRMPYPLAENFRASRFRVVIPRQSSCALQTRKTQQGVTRHVIAAGFESTSFTLDNMGRFLCNTLQEALDSARTVVGGRTRDFDAIIVGGGTFGCVVAEHLFITDATRSRRILVLEAGPFVLPEHVQNMPYMGGAPDMRVPWVNHPALNYAGLIFAVGGRSLTWGGWSPELLDVELTAWPAVHAGRTCAPQLLRRGEPANRGQGDQRLHLRAASYRASQTAP